MAAVVQDRYGSADALQFCQIPRPAASDDEVLVRVVAAGVDVGMWHYMTGLPYVFRLTGVGLLKPKTRVPGTNMAGVVETVGRNVTRFRPGDEVYGTTLGTFAECTNAREDRLAPKPRNLTFEQAAVIPHGGFVSLQALRDRARVQSGQRVLIIGAAGAVGATEVQLAKAFGAEVTGVGSTDQEDLIRSLGADHFIDRTRDDFADGRQRYDVILEQAGNNSLSRLRRALTSDGTLLTVSMGHGRWIGGTDRTVRALLWSRLVSQKLSTFVAKEHAEDLLALTDLIEAGQLTPVMGRIYPLHEAGDAMRYFEGGRVRGRIAITV